MDLFTLALVIGVGLAIATLFAQQGRLYVEQIALLQQRRFLSMIFGFFVLVGLWTIPVLIILFVLRVVLRVIIL